MLTPKQIEGLRVVIDKIDKERDKIGRTRISGDNNTPTPPDNDNDYSI